MSRLEAHFVPASVVGLARRGHPYDFIETYRALAALYGYSAWYVNLGLWDEGAATVEPGRRLSFRVADSLQLRAGARLVDAGAGLGQAAVDLAARHDLAAVLGVNPNRRQVAFARALAVEAGLAERVRHVEADACEHLFTLPAGETDAILAVECLGHFAAPARFLDGARHALRPGGRLAFCLNLATGPLALAERALMQAVYGFVPETRAAWRGRLDAAGFEILEDEDLTALVTRPATRILAARLAEPGPELRAIPWSTRLLSARFLARTARALDAGRLEYRLLAARSP